MKKYFKKYLLIFIAMPLGIGLIISIIFYKDIFRSRLEWEKKILLWNNKEITANVSFSELIKWIDIHSLIKLGGGDYKYIIKFENSEKEYIWQGSHMPIIIQIDGDDAYIVCFDIDYNQEVQCFDESSITELYLHSYNRCAKYWIYKYNSGSKWLEISKEQFPKYLAIQNIFTCFNSLYDNSDCFTSKRIDKPQNNINEDKFCWSLTANFWYYLYKGYYIPKDQNYCIDGNFIEFYYYKWIQKK